MSPRVKIEDFGRLSDGRLVHEYTLDNGAGMQLKVLDYGCIIRGWTVRTRAGSHADLVLGFDSLSDYEQDRAYFGALVGRFANRIARGSFVLDGERYQLSRNDGANHLHGGVSGFGKQLWLGAARAEPEAATIELRRVSPDGEEGYPGKLTVAVRYTLSADGELCFSYSASADRATPVSISQHSYFNLGGEGDILGHQLCIAADAYLPVRPDLLPNGEFAPVDGTVFDFRQPTGIGSRLCDGDPQLAMALGYDHNFVLASKRGTQACLSDPASGRRMLIHTDAPGLQFYSGNYLDGTLGGKGRRFDQHAGLCLEPQHFPDAPNQPRFPDPICRPGRPCGMSTRYRLLV